MFAFALWDVRRHRLLLVRDRLGIKPLYWAQAGQTLVFASEIKALLASGFITPSPNHQVLPELLSTRYVSGPDTLFRGIQKLLPGHRLVFENGHATVSQWWDVPFRRQNLDVGRQESGGGTRTRDYVAEFRDLLQESVRLRLMADVPLGMFLSGGIDSSAIGALMAGMIDRPVKTFSVGFRDRAFNELGYAREVATAIGAEPHEVVIDDHDFFGALPRLLWHEDEPIAHPSSVPLYFVSRLARQHVTVVLTGEGSDELLAGYGKYPRIALNWRAGTVYERMLPASLRRFVADSVVPALPGRPGRMASRSFLAMGRTPDAMYLDNFAAIRMRDLGSLLHGAPGDRSAVAAAYASSIRWFEQPPAGSSLLTRLLYADMKTYLVELLMKQDQMSMATSIESRVPFLDHRLVEFAATLPDEWKLSGFTTKRILREAMKGVLPASILQRPKMGFPVPFSRWTRGPWHGVVRDVLLDRRTRERGLIDADGVDRLLRDHAAGRTDGWDRLWMLLNLELWHRTFIDGGGVQTLPSPATRASATSTGAALRPRAAGQPAA